MLYQVLEAIFVGKPRGPVVRRRTAITALGPLSLLLSLLSFVMLCELPSTSQDSLASDECQGKTLT